MDFVPRFAQPFTLAEAAKLDVSVITEEIARLENSLRHLQQTQCDLHEYMVNAGPERADPEIKAAFDENKIVIGSQQERILMLKLALSSKGVYFDDHYNLNGKTDNLNPSAHHAMTSSQTTAGQGDGIHL